jgi:hypothetical protein
MPRQLGNLLSHIPDRPAHGRGNRGKGKVDWLDRVDIYDMLEQLEILNLSQARIDEVLFSCPFPGHSSGDSKPSCYMNTGELDKSKATVWKCHGCDRSGNAISFLAEHENISYGEAAEFLRQEYASDWRPPADGLISKEFEKKWAEHLERVNAGPLEPDVIPWERYHKLFTIGPGVDWAEGAAMYDHPGCPSAVAYLFRRGFLPSTLEEWGIGYDVRRDFLTIPICNPDGELVGVKGRAPDDKRKPKYMILGDRGKQKRYGFTHYEKSLVLFGLDKWPDYEGEFVFCEGELDVIALWQIGIPAVCTGSAHLSEAQAKLMRDHCNGVVLFFDSDNAGKNATWGVEREDGTWSPGLVEKLAPFMSVRIVRKHRWDPSAMVQRRKFNAINKMIAEAKPWTRFAEGMRVML